MWSLASDDSKVEGKGTAVGAAVGEHGTQILITKFEAASFPQATGGGRILIDYVAQKGFTLESDFRHSDEALKFLGEYQSDSDTYVFYLFGRGPSHSATGALLSSVRVDVRVMGEQSWVADTYSSIDGESIHVQSYRFTRR